MKRVTIVFTRSTHWWALGSHLIRLWTGKPYSHVAQYIDAVAPKEPVYYHAAAGTVHYQVESEFLKNHKIVKTITMAIPTNIYNRVLDCSWNQLGKPYGLMQNLGIVLMDLLRPLKCRLENPFKQGINCSELIYTQLIVPTLGPQGYSPDTIKPHHIERILEAQCQKNLIH